MSDDDLDLDMPELNDTRSLWACVDAFRPPRRIRMEEWCIENIKTDLGAPYNHFEYPHNGAPGGPCDAIDDFRTSIIVLQFAAQVSKTFLSQCFLLFKAATEPGPSLFASSIENTAKQVVERLYEMIHRVPKLNAMLIKSEREQRQGQIEFADSDLFVGWSKSVSTLADKSVRWGHANEIDKWEQVSTSKEAEPLELFLERFKQYLSIMKAILEGTPTIRGQSRVESRRLSGTNCQFKVPCPHCKGYQRLVMGGRETKHGIRWEWDENGKSDPALAFRTARYVCQHCEEAILDHHRPWMMRHGVWSPEGCTVKDDEALRAAIHWEEITQRNLDCGPNGDREFPWEGWDKATWIEGTPARDGTVASYQLPSWYSLKLGWGHVAQKFVESAKRPQLLRNFVNSWAAETWETIKKKHTWEQLGERIIVNVPRRIAPVWAGLVTIGCDKQIDHYVYVVKAWGTGWRSHTLDYGTVTDLDALQDVIATDWDRENGGQLKSQLTLIDSNFRPKDVHAFIAKCRRARLRVVACRGSNKPLGVYYIKRKNSDQSSNPGKIVIEVDTFSTQDEMDRRLHIYEPGKAGSISLFSGPLSEHQDYLEQVLNDAPGSALDSTNHVREFWQRPDTDIPNDYRDCERYADVAMQVHTRGRIISPASEKEQTPRPTKQPRKDQGLPKLPDFKPFNLPSTPRF